MTGKTKKGIGKIPVIEYGSVSLNLHDIQPHEVKIRISTMIDEDILLTLKKIAKDTGSKYQTLLNSILRTFIQNNKLDTTAKPPSFSEDSIRKIVKEEIRKHASKD